MAKLPNGHQPQSYQLAWASSGKTRPRARAAFGQQLEHEFVVDFDPLCVVLNKNGKEQVVVNVRGLLHMEHFRDKTDKTVEEPKMETSEEGSEMQEVLKVNPDAWFEGD